jgi:hypothetical protein
VDENISTVKITMPVLYVLSPVMLCYAGFFFCNNMVIFASLLIKINNVFLVLILNEIRFKINRVFFFYLLKLISYEATTLSHRSFIITIV